MRVSHLRSLLSSPEFAAAAWSVAAAYATAVPALRQLDLGSVTRLCAAAGQGGSLQFVQRLATKVVLHGSKEDVTRNSASREVTRGLRCFFGLRGEGAMQHAAWALGAYFSSSCSLLPRLLQTRAQHPLYKTPPGGEWGVLSTCSLFL